MLYDTVHSSSFLVKGRIDSRYFLSPGIRASERISQVKVRGVPSVPLHKIAVIWQPPRFAKVEAGTLEEKVAYLQPYDVFEYFPRATEFLSVKRSRHLRKCILKRGMILQSCSGRNLGPAVFVDSYLERFVVGSDMIRIEIEDESIRYFVLAYLQSETGQQLLTQGKTGSVIDHVSKQHIGSLEIPLLEESTRALIANRMATAIALREKARLALDKALSDFEGSLPSLKRRRPLKYGWTVRAKNLTHRLDAASYDPLVANARAKLKAEGGIEIKELAAIFKPPSRYKRHYVDKSYGRPILSGAQLLQARPINIRYIASRSFDDPSAYEVKKNWIAYQADGRAEEGLGLPVMITADRNRWLASGHIGRVVGREGIDPGWLYLAMRCSTTQLQLKSLASGSVVDSTFTWDMESVIVPAPTVSHEIVVQSWEGFAEAQRYEDEAVSFVERSLASVVSALELEFHALAERWRKDTGMLSVVDQKLRHDAYKRIIQLGKPVLPLILGELQKKREHWLGALQVITGEDPVRPDSSYNQAVDSWLEWGKRKGIL